MTIDRERWRKIEAIYQAAMDKAEQERQTYLDQACGNNADLRSLI